MKYPFLRKLEKSLKYLVVGDQRRLQFYADGLGVNGRTLGFLEDPRFKVAWEEAVAGNELGWQKAGAVPDIRWRAHVCCWAANVAKTLEGDFVEFGVHTGLLSMTVCKFLDFASLNKKLYLFDTFEGIPISDELPQKDSEMASRFNMLYFDVLEIVQKNFAPYPNVEVVKGELPASIDLAPIDKIAYVSIDLNSNYYEQKTIEAVWDKIVPRGVIVIDDYLFRGHEDQYEMWNELAAQHNTMVLSMPTGQGVLIKP